MPITFAAYIKAVKPVYTMQLMFSNMPDAKSAEADILKKFDKYYPAAKDRCVFKLMTADEYRREADRASRLNYELNN